MEPKPTDRGAKVPQPRPGYCVVRYNGAQPGVPSHLQKRLVVQGVEFATGELVEVPAVGADCFRKAAFRTDKIETAEILAGEPGKWEPVRPVTRAGARTVEDFRTPFTPPPTG